MINRRVVINFARELVQMQENIVKGLAPIVNNWLSSFHGLNNEHTRRELLTRENAWRKQNLNQGKNKDPLSADKTEEIVWDFSVLLNTIIEDKRYSKFVEHIRQLHPIPNRQELSLDIKRLINLRDKSFPHRHLGEFTKQDLNEFFWKAERVLRTLGADSEADNMARSNSKLEYSDVVQIKDDPNAALRWRRASQEFFESRLNDSACAWILPWKGINPGEVHLDFNEDDKYAEGDLPPILRERLKSWRHPDPGRDSELRAESYGLAIRLVRQQFNHMSYHHTLYLGQVKYWEYLACHKSLSNADDETRTLRGAIMDNALSDLPQERRCILPSHFCLHMWIISNDGFAIFRKRAAGAHMFAGRWEFGIGEFMHGPAILERRFQAFVAGKPDMFAFCRAAIAEEVDVDDPEACQFKIFGFAVEYKSLAPKLLVLHYSKLDHQKIIDGMLKARDASPQCDAALLNPQAIASVFGHREQWGPTSKLCLWLALKESAEKNHVRI